VARHLSRHAGQPAAPTCIYAARARARAGAPIATCILMHDELTPDNHATAFFVKKPSMSTFRRVSACILTAVTKALNPRASLCCLCASSYRAYVATATAVQIDGAGWPADRVRPWW
jgi:hypothetical protein